MRKAGLIAVIVSLLLSGCSYMDVMKLLPATRTPAPPTLTPTATVYMTPTETPTITPTQPTPTFTPSPTMIYPNGTPVPTLTFTPPSTQLLFSTGTPTLGLPSQSLTGTGPFSAILVSGSQLLWGGCEPSSVNASVKVQAGIPAAVVTIWLRLQDVSTGERTAWGGGAIMNKQGGGVFTYPLTAKNFEHYREFPKAWGQYQFVASDRNLQRLGASAPYLSNLTISRCP